MNIKNIKLISAFIIGIITAFLVMYFLDHYKIEKKNQPDISQSTATISKNENTNFNEAVKPEASLNSNKIDELTSENLVINYVKTNQKLPDYYITKSEARKQGWVASKGNLCEVLPGRAIGGDHFSNREKTLPSGEQYYEADVNYNCGRRNADRIVFTKNGDVWLTKNHYKSFEKQ